MRRILVKPVFVLSHNRVCGKCLEAIGCNDGRPVVVEVPLAYWVGFPSDVFEVTAVARDYFAWRVFGHPLCGRTLPALGWPPYDMLWLPRLFQFAAPEDREALREAMAMMALAGGP